MGQKIIQKFQIGDGDLSLITCKKSCLWAGWLGRDRIHILGACYQHKENEIYDMHILGACYQHKENEMYNIHYICN